MKRNRKLVRGIDEIPPSIETAANIRAALCVSKALGSLDRLIAKTPKGQRRDLQRLRRLTLHCAAYITGGFVVDQDGNLV